MLEVGPHVRHRIVRVEDETQPRQRLEVVQGVGIGPQVVQAIRGGGRVLIGWRWVGGWNGSGSRQNLIFSFKTG